MEISTKSYFKPTPVNIRKFADSLLIGAVYIQANPALLGDKWTRRATMVVIAMKIISNFFSATPVPGTEAHDEPSSPQ